MSLDDIVTYRVSDFIPLDPEIYARLFVRVNEALWPWQILLTLFACGVLVSVWRKWKVFTLSLLAVFQFLHGYVFHHSFFSELNWFATYFAMAFYVQGILLLLISLAESSNEQTKPSHTRLLDWFAACSAGLVLLLSAFIPLIPAKLDNAPGIVGLAPDTTVLFTLCVTWCVTRKAWILLPISGAWLIISTLLSRETGVQYGGVYSAAATLYLIIFECIRRIASTGPR